MIVAHELQKKLGRQKWTPADSTYWTPSNGELVEIINGFWAFMAKHGLIRWDQKHDCDDKSLLFAPYARWWYYKKRRAEMPETIAVGIYWYRIEGNPRKPHAINWAVTNDGVLRWVEPQSFKQVNLSVAEQESLFWVYG